MSLFPDLLTASEQLASFMIDIRDELERSTALKSHDYSFDFFTDTPLKTLGETPLFQWTIDETSLSQWTNDEISLFQSKVDDQSDICEINGRMSDASQSTVDSRQKVMRKEAEDDYRNLFVNVPAVQLEIAEEEELEEDLDEGEVTPLPMSTPSILRKPSY